MLHHSDVQDVLSSHQFTETGDAVRNQVACRAAMISARRNSNSLGSLGSGELSCRFCFVKPPLFSYP
jgi:hypothetical protein